MRTTAFLAALTLMPMVLHASDQAGEPSSLSRTLQLPIDSLEADSLIPERPAGPCDKITMKSGKVIEGNIVMIDFMKISYQPCGMHSVVVVPRHSVKKVAYAPAHVQDVPADNGAGAFMFGIGLTAVAVVAAVTTVVITTLVLIVDGLADGLE